MTPDSVLYFRAGADPSGKDRDVIKAVEKARAAVWSLSDLGMTGATTPETLKLAAEAERRKVQRRLCCILGSLKGAKLHSMFIYLYNVIYII